MSTSLRATPELVRDYGHLFVNRGAYTIQSARPDRRSGRNHYFRPRDAGKGGEVRLSSDTIRRHLEGEITIGLYAINPVTQRCKWIVVDADCPAAFEDLLRLQRSLGQEGVEAPIESSRRGGHLWIFMERPALARNCRLYAYNLASKLGMQIKGSRGAEGLEIFPKQDELLPNQFGSAVRGPLGVHRGDTRRYWFRGAACQLGQQIAYLNGLRKMSEEQLCRLVAGKTMPVGFEGRKSRSAVEPLIPAGAREFHILDHVGKVRRVGRNYLTRCPSCARDGRDRSCDNLAICVDDPRKYLCWAGCTKEMIRSAVGCPIPARRSA